MKWLERRGVIQGRWQWKGDNKILSAYGNSLKCVFSKEGKFPFAWYGWYYTVKLFPHVRWLRQSREELSPDETPWSFLLSQVTGLAVLSAMPPLLATKQKPSIIYRNHADPTHYEDRCKHDHAMLQMLPFLSLLQMEGCAERIFHIITRKLKSCYDSGFKNWFWGISYHYF